MPFHDLNSNEQRIVQIVLEALPAWNTILVNQIRCAKVSREDLYSMYVIKFYNIPQRITRVPVSRNVPIQIFILPGDYEKVKVTYSFDGRIFFADEDKSEESEVIGLTVFFQKGILFEIEVFTSSLEKINFAGIEKGQRCYQIKDREALCNIHV